MRADAAAAALKEAGADVCDSYRLIPALETLLELRSVPLIGTTIVKRGPGYHSPTVAGAARNDSWSRDAALAF